MMIKKATILIPLFAFIFFSACKKYPEGPLLSLHTKGHRIEGTWNIEYFSINRSDSTEYLKSKPFFGQYIFQKNFYEINSESFIYYCGNTYDGGASWKFSNNKKYIESVGGGIINQNTMPPYILYVPVKWEIRRLTETQMWLKTNYDNREFYIKLKLQK